MQQVSLLWWCYFLVAVVQGAGSEDICANACDNDKCRVCSVRTVDCTGAHLGRWCPAWMSQSALHSLLLPGNALGPSIGNQLTALRRARKLDLSRNDLVRVDAQELAHMIELEELNLSDNRLKTLSNGLFAGLAKLMTLKLNRAALTQLPSNAFAANQSALDRLELVGNQLDAIPTEALARLPSLRHVDLSHNPLGPRLEALVHAHLEELRLDNCDLESIDALTFAQLPALRTLHLSGNAHLMHMDTDAFAHVSTPHIAPQRLEALYLVGNALTNIAEDMLDWRRVRVLAARSNPWRCDCHMRWLVVDAGDRISAASLLNDAERTVCHWPRRLKGRAIVNVSASDMWCTERHKGNPLEMTLLAVLGAIVLIALVALAVLPRNEQASCAVRTWIWLKARRYSMFQ